MDKKKVIVVIVILCLLVFGYLFFASKQRSQVIKNESALQQEKLLSIENNIIPQSNTLYIPSLALTADISEGEYEGDRDYLKTWRRTHTNTPDKGGNTVIVGHRYEGQSEYPLFEIDTIKEGDELTLYWEGVAYDYKVFNTLEVDLYDISVEDPTDEDILTLYACDWSGKNRLVVQAELQ